MKVDIVNKKIVVGVSGGKDSTALALYMIDNEIECEFYFCDTGWEHPQTYEYIDYLEKKIGKIIRIEPELKFEDLVKKKKMFPSRRFRYCTQFLKVNPFKKHYGIEKEFRDDLISVTGERSEESPSRAKKPVFEKDTWMGCYMWRPIKDWSWEDVFAIAKHHDIKPNPLYTKGFKRVGCFPCIYANKPDYKALNRDPFGKERIEVIKYLEETLGIPWVILRRTGSDISGIQELLDWSENPNQEELFPFENQSCSSHYKLCE